MASACAHPAEEAGRLDRDAFVARFGGVFERSPWVAEAAWGSRPFADAAALHAAMVAAVRAAPRERRLELIRAHPELAGRDAAEGRLGAASEREQRGAGLLDALDADRRARLGEINAAYAARFGFPLVICVREHDADSIVATAGARLTGEQEVEERTALEEIAKIARLRLDDLLGGA
jgi:2-oxo-4-hydroxy-4-carboxy-5-ureidoimidazoline decarboxylase